MQRTKVVKVHNHDLKDAISNVKSDEYRSALKEVHDPAALNVIARQVVMDFQLTQDDRVRLLGDVERTIVSAG